MKEKIHDEINSSSTKRNIIVPKHRDLTLDEYVEGVINTDINILGQAITLVESNASKHLDLSQAMLQKLLPYTGKSIRIGITGVPGAGKSTFIESLGLLLCDKGHKVAVLAVDPSSPITRGSILGDKTRMEQLSRNTSTFIRPSPSSGTLGGVARKSRETMLVCEAAGFDVILIETVGVGQSEITVHSMVDFFLILLIAGAGDELQGIKKGILELADAILINKADGDNKLRANMACAEYNRALHYLQPTTKDWYTKAYTCSAISSEGISDIWQIIQSFQKVVRDNGLFEIRRKRQTLDWLYSMIEEYLHKAFFENQHVQSELKQLEEAVTIGQIPPTVAAKILIEKYEKS